MKPFVGFKLLIAVIPLLSGCGGSSSSDPAPVVTIDPLNTTDTTPQLTGTVDDPTATIAVTVDGNVYAATNNSDGTWTLADNAITPALLDDTYDIAVTATDTFSNAGSDATTDELEVDATAPVVTIDPLNTTDTTPQLTGTVDDPTATIAVTVDGNVYAATNNSDGTWTLADNAITPALLDDTYDIAVTATDTFSNAGSDATTDELEVDATAPVVTIDPLNTTDTTPQLTGTVDDPTATIAVTVDGNVYAATNNSDGTWTLADNAITPALLDDTYDIAVTATDTFSNADSDATTDELEVDTIPGLTVRPTNALCVAGESPAVDSGVFFEVIDSRTGPYRTKLLLEPGDYSRWFLLQRQGRVFAYEREAPNERIDWLDIRNRVTAEGNGGLISLAFHPDYPATPEIFIYYSEGTADAFVTTLSRVTVDNIESPTIFDMEDILSVNQATIFHQGGDIVFGPDGYLYLSIGESGDRAEAQNTNNLRGSVIRIDVLGNEKPYGIPAGNPFDKNAKCGPGENADSCPELFAWGLRNPFRASFDGLGQLWVGDVGKDDWEEINIVSSGGNYGWPCRQGAHDWEPDICSASAVLTDPLFEYSHEQGDGSVTGGHVYTGQQIPELQGKYVFADFVSGRIFVLESDGNGVFSAVELVDTPVRITSFAEDENGELFFDDFDNGSINKLIPASSNTGGMIAEKLSETGCFDPSTPTQPVEALIPYDINAPFWSDEAEKSRYLALPDGMTIEVELDGDFTFPVGSVLVKNFILKDRLIETRLLMHHSDGIWAGYTYAWDEDGADATRVIGGRIDSIHGQPWLYPSEGQCMECHTSAARFALGTETGQLNKTMEYASTGITSNQLFTLNDINFFSVDIGNPEDLSRFPSTDDLSQPLADRAKAWLHTNCAQCHRPQGTSQATIDFRYSTPLASMNVCNVPPSQGDLGLNQALLVAPGNPDRSVVLNRLERRDDDAMPPLGTFIPDTQGVTLISEWIESLETCF